MPSLTVDLIGVSSQRSSEVLVRERAQGQAGNGLRFICTEDEAYLSDYDETVVDSYSGSRPAVVSHFMKEKVVLMCGIFSAAQAGFDLFMVCSDPCKNMPKSFGESLRD